MGPANGNWLSYSLSSMEMLQAASQSHQLLSSAPTLDHHHQTPCHHFLWDNLYANEWLTQNSSTLTHIYNAKLHASTYLCDAGPPLVTGVFQALSTNSGSEVDDSSQMECAEFVGQSQFGSSGSTGLSLSTVARNSDKAVVVSSHADSDGAKKVPDTFGQRTSIYRGVTRHRWTGRFEAHLWDNSCRREGQARKGRQVYLGGYDKEEKAARAYDLAALKYWGPTATTNVPISCYSKELEDMEHMTKQEFIASLRRKSSGFSRGASIYRGVTRHHQQGRWQARIGRVAGNKDLYLGTFASEEEAAEAYDIAAIKFRGVNAVTNFEMNRYDVDTILKSALPVGGSAKRLKMSPCTTSTTTTTEQKPILLLQANQQYALPLDQHPYFHHIYAPNAADSTPLQPDFFLSP